MFDLPILAQAGGLAELLPVILILFFLFYLLVLRPERRRQQQQKSMLDGLKKNDRVVTIGGIKGTIAAIRREADEVTVKVDDNTKLRMTVASIARVESDQSAANDKSS